MKTYTKKIPLQETEKAQLQTLDARFGEVVILDPNNFHEIHLVNIYNYRLLSSKKQTLVDLILA